MLDDSAEILIVDSTGTLAHALDGLPHLFNHTDFSQSYDLVIVSLPISEPLRALIEGYNPRTPLIVLGAPGDAETAAWIAAHPDTHRLTEATPEALLQVIQNVLGGALRHGSPPVEQTLRRYSDELSTLYAITEAVSQPLDLQETMRATLDAIWQHTDYTSGAIAIYDAETGQLIPVAWRGVLQVYLDSFAHLGPDSHRRQAVQTGEPLFIPDIAAASARVGRDLSFGTDCVSSLVLPLQARGRTLGLMSLGSVHPHTYSAKECAMLTGIAHAVSVAIDTAQTLAQEQSRAAELALLSDVGLILQDTANLEKALREALARIQQTIAFDGLAVGKVDLIANRMLPFVNYKMPPSLQWMIQDTDLQAYRSWGNLLEKDELQVLTRLGEHFHGLSPDDDWPPDSALVVVPLRAHETVHGVLLLYRGSQHTLSENERRVLHLIAHRIALALETAQLYDEMRRRAHEVTALLATSEAVSSNLDLNTRLEIIAERAKRLIKADGVVLYLLQADGETIRPQIILHPKAEEMRGVSYRLGEGLSGRVALRGQGEIINDAPDHQDDFVCPPGIELPACLLSVPLRVEEHVLGVLTLNRSGSGASFHNSDLRLLSSLANQAAIAIENVHLFEENNQQRRFAETLSRVSRLVSATFDLDKVLEIVLRELRSVIDFDSAHVRLIEGEEMRVAHHAGYPTNPPPRLLTMNAADLPTSRLIVRTRRHMVIADTSSFEGWQTLKGTEYIRSWIGVPLISRGRVIGILSVESETPHAYSDQQGAMVAAFANQIAATIDNARLFRQTEARERESRTLYEVTRLLVSLDVQSIPGYVLEKLRDAIHFDLGGILMAGEPERVVLYVTGPINDETFHGFGKQLIAYYEDLAGASVSERTLVQQVIGEAHIQPAAPVEPLPSRLSAPLMVANDVIGCIQLSSFVLDIYTEDEARTLYTVATQMATALDNARLYESLKRSLQSLQETYDELAEADRLKDELVQNVSHEIRTPLTFIKSYVDLLVTGEMGELTQDQLSALDIVTRKTNVLKGLVDDIVSLKKIDADTLDLRPLNLADLACQAAEGFLPAATEEELNVVAEVEPGLPPVMADRDRLGQVMDNLLSNARKFSPPGSTITIRALDRGSRVRVEVQDQGIGIPDDKHLRVFERFYQVDGSTRRRYGGAGLGLAISKQIIEAHNGVIGVESKVGEGSLFYFELYKVRRQPGFEEPPVSPSL